MTIFPRAAGSRRLSWPSFPRKRGALPAGEPRRSRRSPAAGAAETAPGAARGLRRPKWAASLAIGALLLAGCETLQEIFPSGRDVVEPDASRQDHVRALSGFRNWSLFGTLVVRSDGDASQVTMRWRQSDDAYLMRFMGPLGVALFEVGGSAATGAQARFPNGRRTRAASPEALLEQEIGWSVPLGGLRYWIVGAPMPGGEPPRMELDDRGRLVRLEQAGWTVVYERYGDLGDLALPERIRFSGDSIDAMVVIRRWKAEREPA